MGKVKLQLLTTTEDTKDNVVSFTSGDTANPTAFKDVAVLASNENHKSILNKISTMFNNVRYLYKILGTTDISTLGTVTQAISTIKGNIGDMKGISSSAAITTEGEYALDAREKNASIEGTLANQIGTLNSNLLNAYLDRTASIKLSTDGNDSPEYMLSNNAYTSYNDIYDNALRWFTIDNGQNIKFPLTLDLSNDIGYIFSNQILTANGVVGDDHTPVYVDNGILKSVPIVNKSRLLTSEGCKHWDDNTNMNSGFGMFYYEGHNTDDFNIPIPYCMVLVCKQSTARGVAIAIQWNTSSSTSRPMWINTLCDNWKGWVQVIG